MSVKDPEAMLKALRKLDANKTCPNCGTMNEFGFGNICVKFRTFVCDNCKSSHQAISHRVKSITMSTWTLDEVRELTDQMGGGNNAARHMWLLNAPSVGGKYSGGKRPMTGDPIDVFKKFVVDCYDLGKFKAATPYIPGTQDMEFPPLKQPVTPRKSSPRAAPEPSSPAVSLSPRAAASPPEIDLLGFDAPVLTESSTPGLPPTPTDFNAFGAFPPAVQNTTFDAFNSTSSAAPDTSRSGFGFLQEPVMAASFSAFTAPPAASSPSPSVTSLDPFGQDFLVPTQSGSAAAFPQPASPSYGGIPQNGGMGTGSYMQQSPMAARPNSSFAISSMDVFNSGSCGPMGMQPGGGYGPPRSQPIAMGMGIGMGMQPRPMQPMGMQPIAMGPGMGAQQRGMQQMGQLMGMGMRMQHTGMQPMQNMRMGSASISTMNTAVLQNQGVPMGASNQAAQGSPFDFVSTAMRDHLSGSN